MTPAYISRCTRRVAGHAPAAPAGGCHNHRRADAAGAAGADGGCMTMTLTHTEPLHRTPGDGTTAAHTVGATKVYGHGESGVRALDDVSVDFAAARFTAIMGPSGSGKSTLMHALAGLDSLTSG